MFQDNGIFTKGDMIDYYMSVASLKNSLLFYKPHMDI